MLKYIQEILQNLRKETQKIKIKHNKTRTNSFLSSKRKTSIHPEILAPVGNEKHEFENTHHVLKIKKTYNMLMKKLVSPNLDLMPRGNKILEQLKNMDSKQRQEMFSSLLPNSFFAKPKKKKLPGAPFDEKLQFQEKIKQSCTNSFAIGWSGQATTKSLKPIVEVASKYPFDIDSAFLDYTDIKKLNTKKSRKGHTKKLKKVSHKRIKKTTTHASTNSTKAKKSVQLFKEIPKSHISKLHRLNAERKERALQQSVLEPMQVYISDSPTDKSITEVTDSKSQPICTDIDVNNNFDTKYQLVKDTVSNSVEKPEFQEEKEFENMGMADNWEEPSQNDHSKHEKQINSIYEKSQDYEKLDERLIAKQTCPNENISPETNREKQNTDKFLLTKMKTKCTEIKYHQTNVDSRPTTETAHQVGSTTNKMGSIFPNISENDDINLAKVKDLERGYVKENNPHSSINDSQPESYSYVNDKNITDSAVKTDADQINQIALSNKPIKNEVKGLSEENLSLITNQSMNSNSTCVNSQMNHRLDPILESISLTNLTAIKDFEKDNNLKELSTLSHKKTINLNQLQYLKKTRSPVTNEVVYNKALKKEEVDFNIDTSFSKSSSKAKKYKNVENGNIYKKHLSNNVDVAEGKVYNNNKSLTNIKESCVVSKPQKKNKKKLRN